MPTTFQFRRGTTSQNNAFTGAAGEISIDTDTNAIRVHDGSTAGGATVGATITQDNSSNTNFNLYFNSTTSGSLAALKYDGGTLTFNPSTETLVVTNTTTTASTAKYADLAEKYTSDDDYEAGTVLVFGGEQEVTQCVKKYDKRIAGIVSTNPAYLMNSDSTGVAVGLIGRVPCKVIGEIRKGDIMVASDTPGHAEAWKDESNPMTGSVIGKALEDKYGASTSIIEVVVGKI